MLILNFWRIFICRMNELTAGLDQWNFMPPVVARDDKVDPGFQKKKKKGNSTKSCCEKQKILRRRASSFVLNDTISCDWTNQVSPYSRRGMRVYLASLPFPFCHSRPFHNVERIAPRSGRMFPRRMTIEGGIIGGLGVLKHAASCYFLVIAIYLAPQAMKTTSYLGARRMRRDWWAREPRMRDEERRRTPTDGQLRCKRLLHS